MNIRVMPPPAGATTTVNGRAYIAAPGATLDVPDFDSSVLEANGWTRVAGAVGTTATRPLSPAKTTTFHDTTLNVTIVWDGKVWRNPATGAAV